MSEAKTVTVGTATAAHGTSVRGAIPVTTLAGGTPLEIPVVVINGAAAGPCFWVDGAIHGDEPEGPLACQIAMREIDPAQLAGTVVLVPVMNVPAFEAAQRGNPLDTFSYDMNRIYPGRANGYLTERMAAAHAAAMVAAARTRSSTRPSSSTSRRRRWNWPPRWDPGGAASCRRSARRAARWRT
jgi:predicted deacylase